jgi:fatty acid/phospholipid biosynthesis enzyme
MQSLRHASFVTCVCIDPVLILSAGVLAADHHPLHTVPACVLLMAQVASLESTLRARESELTSLTKALAAAQGGEVAAALKASQAEEAVRKLDAELAAARQKLVQADSAAKVHLAAIHVVLRIGLHGCA